MSFTNLKQQLDLFIESNEKTQTQILKMYSDITYRKDILSTWQQAPPELREAARSAYEDSVSKHKIIYEASSKIENLKEVLNYIRSNLNTSFQDTNPVNVNTNVQNITNLLNNYATMQSAFLAHYGQLLNA